MLAIKSKTVGKWKETSYLLEYQNESWLVDTGDDYSELDSYFKRTNYRGILCTHGHFDHIGAIYEFQKEYSLDCYIHSKDRHLATQANLYRKLAGDVTVHKTPKFDFFLDDMKTLNIGDKKIIIHHVPGHTNGSVCFEIDRNVFLGDLILNGSLGKTDLPGSDVEKIYASLNYVIEKFSNYMIHPGHGDPFSLDEELITKLKNRA